MNSDIYSQVTSLIISQLEKGVAPWRSPYLASSGLPRNFSSGNCYQGINVFLLALAGYSSPYFLTFLQARELGGHVRKGEHGHLVIKCGTWTKDKENPAPGEDLTETRHFLKGYTVFNASQIEGISFPEIIHPERTTTEVLENAEAILRGMPCPPSISEGTTSIPSYNKHTDSIAMPARAAFRSDAEFLGALYHEAVHSTGHQSRLGRRTLIENKGFNATGDARKIYSEEELVAEMGAAFLSAHAGITVDEHENSVAYLQGWLSVLKVSDHKGWVIRAASEAQKAANYILGTAPASSEATV
jgi:antirestriction protein ArdC